MLLFCFLIFSKLSPLLPSSFLACPSYLPPELTCSNFLKYRCTVDVSFGIPPHRNSQICLALLFTELVPLLLQHCCILKMIVFWVNLSSSYVETSYLKSEQCSEAASGVHKENMFGLHVEIKQYRGCISVQCCVTAQKENIFFKMPLQC